MGVFEMGSVKPQLLGVIVHQGNEGFLTAGDMLSDRHSGVVAGGNHNPFFQFSDSDALAGFNPHQRGASESGILGPGVATHRHLVIQGQASGVNLLRENIRGHQFGQAGRGQAFINVVGHQHLTCKVVQQEVGIGLILGGAGTREAAPAGAQHSRASKNTAAVFFIYWDSEGTKRKRRYGTSPPGAAAKLGSDGPSGYGATLGQPGCAQPRAGIFQGQGVGKGPGTNPEQGVWASPAAATVTEPKITARARQPAPRPRNGSKTPPTAGGCSHCSVTAHILHARYINGLNDTDAVPWSAKPSRTAAP